MTIKHFISQIENEFSNFEKENKRLKEAIEKRDDKIETLQGQNKILIMELQKVNHKLKAISKVLSLYKEITEDVLIDKVKTANKIVNETHQHTIDVILKFR